MAVSIIIVLQSKSTTVHCLYGPSDGPSSRTKNIHLKQNTTVLCMTAEYFECVSSQTVQSCFKFCGGGSLFSGIFHKLRYGSLLKQCLVE